MFLCGGLVDCASSREYALDDRISHLDVNFVALSGHWLDIPIDMRSHMCIVMRCNERFDESTDAVGCLAVQSSHSSRVRCAVEHSSVSQICESSTNSPRLERL